jgi:hypothetical protein
VILSVIGVLVVIIAISVAFSSNKQNGSPSAGTTSAPAASPAAASPAAAPASGPPATPGLGQVARDGDFAFVVKRKSCGAAAAAAVYAGGMGETVPAGAVECIFTIRVTDDKGTAQTFFDSNQYAYDAAGRQYSADTNASVYLAGDVDATQVNPGITITARVPFQIPAGVRITTLVLHDSAFSGGVTVKV